MKQQAPLFDDLPAPAASQALTLAIAGQRLGPAQKQFNQWLTKIESLKAALLEAERLHAHYLPERARRLDPLLAEINALQSRMVVFLDQRLQQPKGLSRKVQAGMTDIMLSLAEALIGDEGASPEVEAIYERHAPDLGDPDAGDMDDPVVMAELRQAVSQAFGVELGEDADLDSPDALLEAMLGQARAAQEAAEQARAARRAKRGKTPRQQQQELEQQSAEKTVRDIYRKLASALHPDRSADEPDRARRAALMAQVNAANDRKDLLTLLQLQLQIEQINPDAVAAMADEKLRHFNRVLKEQAQSLQQQLSMAELQLREEFGMDYRGALTARAIDASLRRQAQEMQQSIRLMKHDLADIQQDARLKTWVKEQVAAMAEPPDMLDLALLMRQP